MSAVKVGNMINWMCRYYLDLHDLSYLLPEVLDDRVITQTDPLLRNDYTARVYGSHAQIELICVTRRRIR
jgi:hypothetical protein